MLKGFLNCLLLGRFIILIRELCYGILDDDVPFEKFKLSLKWRSSAWPRLEGRTAPAFSGCPAAQRTAEAFGTGPQSPSPIGSRLPLSVTQITLLALSASCF